MNKVGIILVNYNNCADTIECIESLKKINYPNYEIIVVDNNSTDNSFIELEKRKREITLINAAENLGFSGGNNLGIAYMKKQGYKYILLLNNDTIVNQDFLSIMVETCNKYNNEAIISPKIMYASKPDKIWYAGGTFSRKTGRTTHIGIQEIDKGQYNTEREVTFITGCCMLIPIDIIDAVGNLDEKYFLYCEDLDYCCRAYDAHYKLVYVPEALIYHKISSSTTKITDLVAYYSARNKRYIIEKYMKGVYKQVGFVYNFLEEQKRILYKEYSRQAIKKAKKDYKMNRIGKSL